MAISDQVASTDPDVLARLREIASEHQRRGGNEADTRHRVIDFVLHDVLAWPRNRVSVEEYVRPGFADYVLRKPNDDLLIFVEAKKEGDYFTLPLPPNNGETSGYISIQILLSNPSIKEALHQVRSYCLDTGCEFACITNGHEWIFLKIFEKGKRWESLQAFVIRNLSFFEVEYTKAYNGLSYRAITERVSLPALLTSSPPTDRNIYYAKDRIPFYSHPITANKLAATLRPVVRHYFGPIGDNDTEFMDRCYVSQRDYKQAFEGMRVLIEDSLTPYFEGFRIQQLQDTGKGGRLGGRLTKNLKKGRKGEVLILFGGKGSGKSTFIKRLLHHKPPQWLRDHSVIAIIDLLTTPEQLEVIRKTIWDGLVQALDTEKLMAADRATLLEKLFTDRFEIASRQELSGLARASDAYNTRLNSLVSEWKNDSLYCAKRLVRYWQQQGKGIIVVIDNTDQFSGHNQDFCFSSAQEISQELECIALISMREERFYNSKIHGLLDAFQNAGFHISSPKPAQVFRKRLDYTISLLGKAERRRAIVGDASVPLVGECAKYLGIISREFNNERSPLNGFLTACAHGDTRLSLDLFGKFLLSGYTNVEEMLAEGSWNFLIHQVIKPVMIPTRYFYDETLSDIPNIYQLRFNRHCSHFTALRILRKLARSVEGSSVSFMSIAELKAYFTETFNMLEDFVRNVDVLLKHGFVEADNRLDGYSDSVDRLRITGYGLYMFSELAYLFPYLDLVCTDTGVFSEQTNNYLIEAARTEYGRFTRNDRVGRVRTRLERVGHFIQYLQAEEKRERDLYRLDILDEDLFTSKSHEAFERESARVIASAQKQEKKRGSRPNRHRRQPSERIYFADE